MLLIGLSHTSSISNLQFLLPDKNICFPSVSRKTKYLRIVAFNKVKELLNNFLPVSDFIRWLNSLTRTLRVTVLVTNLHINLFLIWQFLLRCDFIIRHKNADFVQLF